MAPDFDARIARTIAAEIAARPEQVAAAAALLDGGETVPFVARYRTEATGPNVGGRSEDQGSAEKEWRIS